MQNRSSLAFIALLLALLTAGCVMPITPPPAPEDEGAAARSTTTPQPEAEPTSAPESEQSVATADGIVGTLWLWQNQKNADDKTVIDVPNPETYRLMLQPDGTFNAKADCNMVSGSYTLEGSNISLLPGPMTAAACAPDSLSDQYVALLSQMDTVAGDAAVMRLTASADGTNMNFTKFYAVTGQIIGPEGAQLPQPAEVEVWVNDVSLADAPAKVVGGQTNSNATQFPIEFEATYNATQIDERNQYALTVRISDSQGQLKFINTQNIPVLTQGNPTYGVEVRVDAVE